MKWWHSFHLKWRQRHYRKGSFFSLIERLECYMDNDELKKDLKIHWSLLVLRPWWPGPSWRKSLTLLPKDSLRWTASALASSATIYSASWRAWMSSSHETATLLLFWCRSFKEAMLSSVVDNSSFFKEIVLSSSSIFFWSSACSRGNIFSLTLMSSTLFSSLLNCEETFEASF